MRWLGVGLIFVIGLATCKSPLTPAGEGTVPSPFPPDGIGVSFYLLQNPSCGWTSPPRRVRPAMERLAITYNRLMATGETDEEVAVINADGSGLTMLSNSPAGDGMAEWRLDGEKLVFVSVRGKEGYPQIWVMNPDGSGQTQLTFDAHANINPRWSPDGGKILYTKYVSWEKRFTDLFVMNADGSDQRQLTFHSDNDGTGSNVNENCWSRNGENIIYQHYSGLEKQGSLWIIRPDGSGQSRLAKDVRGPFLSPDGNKIMFFRMDSPDDQPSLYHDALFLMNSDGSNIVKVVPYDHTQSLYLDALAWSPDGTKVIIGDTRSRLSSNLSLLNMKDMSITLLAPPEGNWATWSSDGKMIAYNGSDNPDGNREISVCNADGSGARRITFGPIDKGFAYNPRWAP